MFLLQIFCSVRSAESYDNWLKIDSYYNYKKRVTLLLDHSAYACFSLLELQFFRLQARLPSVGQKFIIVFLQQCISCLTIYRNRIFTTLCPCN